jgi:hypothetical protein
LSQLCVEANTRADITHVIIAREAEQQKKNLQAEYILGNMSQYPFNLAVGPLKG